VIAKALNEIRKLRKITIVVSEQVLSFALEVADRLFVIEGGRPHWLWRTIMGVVGIAAYARSVSLSATTLSGFVRRGQLALGDVRRLVIVAYIAGGLLLVAGAARNSIDPSLVLTSGASSGFGAMMGMLFVPGIVRGIAGGSTPAAPVLRTSFRWAIAGALTAFVFIAILGPGIPLTK